MTTPRQPNVVVLAGPNGAGKSTAAPRLLSGRLHLREFVNADVIAQGLSAFRPEGTAMAAGRILLTRVRELARLRSDFAFETTMASRTFAPWLSNLRRGGYRAERVFLWLPSSRMAVARVKERVRMGGHDVPEETIRRRYSSGLRNFFHLYRPLAGTWRFYDNSGRSPRLVATMGPGGKRVLDAGLWTRIKTEAG